MSDGFTSTPCVFLSCPPSADSVNIKILNAGAWSRSSEKVFVSLPTELEDLIPEVEDFYKKNHSGRKLHWHHLMSNGNVSQKCTCSGSGPGVEWQVVEQPDGNCKVPSLILASTRVSFEVSLSKILN